MYVFSNVKDIKIIRVTPDNDVNSVNQGKLCSKGRFGFDFVHNHTGTMTRRCWGLNGADPEEFLEISPADAKKLKNQGFF